MRQQVCKQRVYKSLKYRFGSQKGFFLITVAFQKTQICWQVVYNCNALFISVKHNYLGLKWQV